MDCVVEEKTRTCYNDRKRQKTFHVSTRGKEHQNTGTGGFMKGFYGIMQRKERYAFWGALAFLLVVVSARALSADDRLAADTQFNGNLALTTNGEYAIARSGWEDFLQKYPENSQRSYAEYYLGICDFRTENYREAESLLEKVISDSKFPNQDETHFFLGVTYLKHSNTFPVQNSGVLRKTVETTANRYYSLSPEASELCRKAVAQFQILRETFPDSQKRMDACFYEAVAYIQLGNYENALGDLQLVVATQHYAELDRALYTLAECYMNLREPDARKAMITLQTLLDRKPETSLRLRAVRLLGDIHFLLGNYDAAAEKYQSIFDDSSFAAYVRPESEDPAVLKLAILYYRYGETFVKLENFAAAAEMFSRVPAQFPQNPIAIYARYQQALAMMKFNEKQAKNPENGVQTFSEADCAALWQSVLDDENVKKDRSLRNSATHQLALYHLRIGEPQTALELVEKVSKKKLTFTLLRDRADALAACGRSEEAIALYRKIFTEHQSPKTLTRGADAMFQAVRIYKEKKDYKNVLDAAGEVIAWDGFERIPDVMQMVFLEDYAFALFQLKDFRAAQDCWERLINRFPDAPFKDSWSVSTAHCFERNGLYKEGYKYILETQKSITDPLKSVEMRHLLGVCCKGFATTFKSQKLIDKYLNRAKKNLILAKNQARDVEYPDRDRLYLDLSDVYFLQKDYENCVKNIGYGLKNCPDSALKDEMYFLRGRCEVEMKALDKAAAAFEETMKMFPKSERAPEAGLLASQCYLKLNQTEKAVEISREMEKKFPNSRFQERGANVRAIAAMESADYDAAMEAWTVILNSDSEDFQPLHPEAMYEIGFCLLQKKDFAAAETQFRTLMQDFPEWETLERAYNQLVKTLLEQKKLEDAQNLLAEMHGKYPKSVFLRSLYSQLGMHWFADGNMNDAETAFRFVIDLSSKKRDFLRRGAEVKIAWTLYNRDRFRETLEFIDTLRLEPKLSKTVRPERAAEICANRAELRFLQGMAFYRVGETKKAYEIMQNVRKIPELEPAFAENALGMMIQIEEDTQKWENLLETEAEFEEIYPKSSELIRMKYKAAFALFRLNRLDESVAACEQILQLSDPIFTSQALFLKGEVFFAQKKYEQAIQMYYQVIYGVEAPQLQADALFEAAQCFEQLGKVDKALKHYHDLLEKYPENDKVKTVRKKMQKLQEE